MLKQGWLSSYTNRNGQLLNLLNHFRATSLLNLSLSLRRRFPQTRARSDLDQSIKFGIEALNLWPEGHPSMGPSLNNLAIGLRNRFEQTGNRHDLDQSIKYDREALNLQPDGHPDRGLSLNNLALGLQMRFQQTGDGGDLDQSIQYKLDVLNLWPEGHPNRGLSLHNLATGLQTRFERSGDRGDLDQSIKYYLEALCLWPDGHPNKSWSLNNLANGLRTRFEQAGNRDDLDESIKYDLEALRLRPEGHPSRGVSLNGLAIGLWNRFDRDGDMGDLDQSIKCNLEALNLWPDGHPGRGMSLNNLAGGLRMRFQQVGDKSDLDQSIKYDLEALNLWPEGHPNRDRSLNNLANGLRVRFQRTGDEADLNQSIKYSLEALNLRPEGHPNRGISLNNLALCLQTRFKQSGDRSDLDRSIKYNLEALSLWPEGHSGRGSSLNNLAIDLRTRFEQAGNRGDLDESIKYDLEALNLWPHGHSKRGASLHNVALGLHMRFQQTGNRSDLDQSIQYNLEALNLRPRGHTDRGSSLNNLAIVLQTLFEQTGSRSDIDQSIKYDREALDLRPVGHPGRGLSLNNLALGLSARFKQTREISDLVPCLSSLQEGAAQELSPVHQRLTTSLNWIRIGRQFDDPSVMEAYTTSILLLNRYITFARGIDARHSRLTPHDLSTQTVNLASDAAACAFERSLPEMGIELFEQGRSVLYSQLGNYRTPPVDLETADSELAKQFRTLSTILEGSIISGEAPGIPSNDNEDVVARYQWAAAEWARVVERIQRLPGFSSFLKSKTFKELQLAASHVPIVIINISKYRSDAIILQHAGPPLITPLPDASPATVRPLSEYMDNIAANPYGIPRDLVGMLREIWRVIVEPVAIQLEQTLKLARGSRVCWMPTSMACSLPLHAAGLYAPGKKNMSDRFISSYTPTLSMLLRSVALAQRAVPISKHMLSPRLLLVSQAIAEGQARLPGVVKEMEKIQAMFPQAVTLDGEMCTRQAVLDGLQDAEWVHFACHGHRNQDEPFKSSFSLFKANDPLTILDIIKHGRPKAELAVLSACHSAEGDKRTPDEAIHMAAGMQFSGFKSVIGTMWASADEVGPIVAEVFYKHMLRNGVDRVDTRDSAGALFEELRRRKVPLERWIHFVHYGV